MRWVEPEPAYGERLQGRVSRDSSAAQESLRVVLGQGPNAAEIEREAAERAQDRQLVVNWVVEWNRGRRLDGAGEAHERESQREPQANDYTQIGSSRLKRSPRSSATNDRCSPIRQDLVFCCAAFAARASKGNHQRLMRVLILNQYFHPDIAATAQLATDLAVDLVQRGHEVTAVAAVSAYENHEASRLRIDHYRGVRIVRVHSFGFGRKRKFWRALDYVSFLATALWPVLAETRPDVLIALSTPPFVAALGLLARRFRGVRLVFWSMDVYPDVAIRLGVLPDKGVATHFFRQLAGHLLRNSDDVVALDDAMRERLAEAGAPRDRLHVIDNWCDGDEVRPQPLETNALRARLGLGNQFTVSYSGNMGRAHDFDTLVDAMALLRDDGICWLFIGDGPQRGDLERRVQALGLRDVKFLPYQERDELPVSLTAAHASIVSLRQDFAGLVVPSKLYGLLAAGVPVLYIGPNEGRVADVIARGRVGVAAPNGDAEALARAVRHLRDDDAERAEMSRRARAMFDAEFSRQQAFDRFDALLTGPRGATRHADG